VKVKQTQQGYSDKSSWARGQAWGLYGYTLCYRYTGDKTYLTQAKGIADYILSKLPSDFVPPWDYLAPDSLKKVKDASTGAITASALIELSQLSGEKVYLETAVKILQSLANSKYFRNNRYFLLDHSVGSFPENSEVDVPLVYADYYFLEALLRLNAIPQK
jgi:rhamnogalacturonyl hydrolase YesR